MSFLLIERNVDLNGKDILILAVFFSFPIAYLFVNLFFLWLLYYIFEKEAIVKRLKLYFTEEEIKDLESKQSFQRILKGEWSDVMTSRSKNDKFFDAKIKMSKHKDGNLHVDFRFRNSTLRISDTLTYAKNKIKLTEDDIENLKNGTNNKVFDAVNENGEITKVFIEVDKDLNSLFLLNKSGLKCQQ